eukprot:1136793-Pelagomonas_calceolata.AAC.1
MGSSCVAEVGDVRGSWRWGASGGSRVAVCVGSIGKACRRVRCVHDWGGMCVRSWVPGLVPEHAPEAVMEGLVGIESRVEVVALWLRRWRCCGRGVG